MTPAVQYDAGADFFVLEMSYQVDVTEAQSEADDDEASDDKIAAINFALAALYDLRVPASRPEPTVSELNAYAKTMGTLSMYPYAREFVQT